MEGKRVEVICIEPNYQQPVRFKKIPYIRIGSSQQPLSNYPDRERDLWSITYRHSFEDSYIGQRYSVHELRENFSYPVLLRKLGEKNEAEGSLRNKLEQMRLIKSDMQGMYQASNLLAVASARNFADIPSLANKGSRIVVYKGTNKLDAT